MNSPTDPIKLGYEDYKAGLPARIYTSGFAQVLYQQGRELAERADYMTEAAQGSSETSGS